MLMKQIYLGLFFVYLVISPLYLFEPGLPQPADSLMAFLILVLATGFVVRVPIHKDLMMIGALFLAYVTIVGLFWFSQHATTSTFWLSPLYYAYNFGVTLVVVTLIKEFRERFATLCLVAFAIAVVLEIAAIQFLPPVTGNRAVGTFNNPNQLGYWGLLVATYVVVLRQEEPLRLIDLALICATGFLVALSLSKAAVLAFALLLLLAVVCQRLGWAVKGLCLALAFISAMIALADRSVVEEWLSSGLAASVADRLANIGEQADDSLAGRGYDRIWRYPEHLVFGAGEGAAWRFSRSQINPHLGQRELHSTLGTVLFSYGIIGFCTFLALLWRVFRRATYAHILYSLPIWAYGLTHQGLRETMLWVFFGMVFGLAHYRRSRSTLPAAALPATSVPARRAVPGGRGYGRPHRGAPPANSAPGPPPAAARAPS